MTLRNMKLIPTPSLILFDMDDTLIAASPKFGEFVTQQIEEMGVAVDPERQRETERWLLYHWMQPAYGSTDPQVNRLSEPEETDSYWREHLMLHLRVLGLPAASIEPIAQDLLPSVLTYQAERSLAPDAISTLEYLSASGYRLGLLSNRLNAIRDIVTAAGIDQYFELISCGGEMGILKPDPRFFHYALDWFGAQPSQTIYIGDNYYADVVGAQFAGLTPILIDPREIFSGVGCITIATLSELQSLL